MLTTVCDTCGTEFHVTAEQLKLREGRVRCGKCHSVFNALATLTQFEARDQAAIADTRIESLPAGPADVAEAAPIIPPADEAITWPSLDSIDMPAAAQPEQMRTAEPPADFTPAFSNAGKEQIPPSEPAAAPADSAAVFDFGSRPHPRRSRWWSPLAFLLVIGLLGQAAFYFRGAIALLVPELKPHINEICAELGCEVPLPRRAELISIETSDLQTDPTNPGVIVLLATLRNRAAFPQNFPALELTLTNERDQPLARRVLQSGDYLADKTEAFEGSSEKQIRLHIEAASLKASGYRLYLFYP